MIIFKNGINVVFSTDSGSVNTPYVCYYLTGVNVGGLFQFRYHGNAIDIYREPSFYTDQFGVPFTSVTLQEFIDSINIVPYISSASNIIFVSQVSDLPTAIGGVINLVDELTYFFTAHVDLLGDRLVCGDNTTILGGSSENCSITSTGLGVSVALITTIYTLPICHITIKDVGTALDIDGTGSVAAYDWTGVNFENIPTIGTIQNISNFIFSKGAFLNSNGLIFDGTAATIGFDNSLIQGNGAVGSVLSILSTATITRRFRIIYSSVVVFGSSGGIDVSATATVPVEGFILDTINFSGGGNYLPSLQYNDNKSLFRNCRGINNSAEISQYHMNGNATTTVISSTNTPVKVEGATTSSAITQKFTNTDNRATYTGALTRIFAVTATLSASSGNNNQVGSYISKNGITIDESEVYITTNGVGKFEGCAIHTLVELSTNDYIEIFIENNSSTTNISVTDLNIIIR